MFIGFLTLTFKMCSLIFRLLCVRFWFQEVARLHSVVKKPFIEMLFFEGSNRGNFASLISKLAKN
jgi:hypothetical protein